MSAFESYYFTLSITCRKCRNSLPVNGLTESLPCPHCLQEVEVPLDTWLSLFDAETVASVRDMELGRATEMSLLGTNQASGTLGNLLPRCGACKEETDVRRLDGLARAGGYRCSCGAHVQVREAPPFARALVPGARWAVHEGLSAGDDGTGGAAQPILFSCMGCGGSLTVDGSDRAVTCSFCGASNFLPDALWHRLHPVPTVEAFFAVVDPEARTRGDDLGPEMFARLASSDDCDVRAAVGRNPKVPPRLLAELVKDDDWEVRAAVAANPSTREGLLVQLLGDDDSDVREAVAARPSLPRAVVDKLLEDDDWEVRKAAVGNPRASTEALVVLAGRETDGDVCKALGARPDLPVEVLVALGGNDDWEARRVAARHGATPSEVVDKLAKDSDSDVRRGVAKRSDLSETALLRLGRDTDAAVLQIVRKKPGYAELKRRHTMKILLIALPLAVAAAAILALAWSQGWLTKTQL